MNKHKVEPRYIDSLFKPYNVMAALYLKEKQKARSHHCVECSKYGEGGCERCEHDFIQQPDQGEKCSVCNLMC